MNRYRPHILVLPEDEANEKLANGFTLDPGIDGNQFQVLKPCGGWGKVLEEFSRVHVNALNIYEYRYMVLLIDFDEQLDRFQNATDVIPENLRSRVFVVGVWSEPEQLRIGRFESVGERLAKECRENTTDTWSHTLLRHNLPEMGRMKDILGPILFPGN